MNARPKAQLIWSLTDFRAWWRTGARYRRKGSQFVRPYPWRMSLGDRSRALGLAPLRDLTVFRDVR
ncbi:MAG: hypothetical protein LAN36_12930 [Acidobacteriia bacterium]|nr:hypothetical protein [Terriglobia bacterium]